MNTWFRRTVGTVGIAGGMLLLGAGAAHADDTALAPGQLDDLFTPTGGPNNQSLQLQTHGDRIDTSTESMNGSGGRDTSASLHTNHLNGRPMPGVLNGLPLSNLVPTDSLGLPRTTSSKLSSLPAVPGTTEDSLAGLPLVGQLTSLGLPGLPAVPGLPGGGALGGNGTSVTDTSTAFPSAQKPSPRRTKTEGLPLVGGLPLLSNGLPVRGTLKPVDDYGIPIGQLPGGAAPEAGGLPLVGDLPLGGSDVLKNDSVTGVPVIGGVGPTPGVSTTAVANRFVPTTGALPQAASQLPLVTEKAYAPRHSSAYTPRHSSSSAEALPLVTGLPAVGGLAGGVLPLLSGIAG
jgi:hypothetical protein